MHLEILRRSSHHFLFNCIFFCSFVRRRRNLVWFYRCATPEPNRKRGATDIRSHIQWNNKCVCVLKPCSICMSCRWHLFQKLTARITNRKQNKKHVRHRIECLIYACTLNARAHACETWMCLNRYWPTVTFRYKLAKFRWNHVRSVFVLSDEARSLNATATNLKRTDVDVTKYRHRNCWKKIFAHLFPRFVLFIAFCCLKPTNELPPLKFFNNARD